MYDLGRLGLYILYSKSIPIPVYPPYISCEGPSNTTIETRVPQNLIAMSQKSPFPPMFETYQDCRVKISRAFVLGLKSDFFI
jgi:hypothetical protein